MRKFRQGDAPVILYSKNGVKLYDFGLNRIIDTDDEDLCNLLLAMGAVEIPPEIPPVPQDLTEVAERINALAGRVSIVEGRSDIRSIGAGLALSGAGELSATGSGGSGGGGANLAADMTATKAVGGVKSGDNWPAGTPLETILRKMLNPVEGPSFTAPSATLSGPSTRLLEPGATASVTLSVNFDRGRISPAYGTSGYRSGPATGYSLNGGATQSGNSFAVTVSEANKSFRAAVSYAAGEQPKDSAGNDFGEPLAAGSVNTNTLTWEFVDALWSNQANIAAVAKEALVSKSAGQTTFNFPAQTKTSPEIFDVPASWTVTAVEMYNDLTKVWDSVAHEFEATDTEHGGVAYRRYTDNRGYAAGGRQIRIKWR